MSTSQQATREIVTALIDSLASGRTGALGQVCSQDVRWWTPLADEEEVGVGSVERALLACLGPTAGRTVLDSVVASEDGSTAVVEQSVLREDGLRTPVTSVLSLRDGQVLTGRTYLDVAAWGSGATSACADEPDGQRRP